MRGGIRCTSVLCSVSQHSLEHGVMKQVTCCILAAGSACSYRIYPVVPQSVEMFYCDTHIQRSLSRHDSHMCDKLTTKTPSTQLTPLLHWSHYTMLS